MTTLVAYHDPDEGTYIGADSLATMGHLRAGTVLKWVTHPSGWAAAGAGPLGAINLMRHSADILFRNLSSPLQFGERLKSVLRKGGFAPGNDEPGPMCWGVSIMLASPDGVWDFDGTLAHQKIEAGRLWAAGSGQPFALGAGEAMQDMELSPQERVERALRAACALDTATGGDLWVGRLTRPAAAPRGSRKPAAKKAVPAKPAKKRARRVA